MDSVCVRSVHLNYLNRHKYFFQDGQLDGHMDTDIFCSPRGENKQINWQSREQSDRD